MDQVQILAEELTSESVTDRRRAARLMASLDEQAAPACVQLLHAVSDADEQVRNQRVGLHWSPFGRNWSHSAWIGRHWDQTSGNNEQGRD